ncbi:MAG TPA: AI-2E family transporter [Methanotrichaceae archaeon]|nr:AI-2E family transporter [Methanotrichaceae archaeon]
MDSKLGNWCADHTGILILAAAALILITYFLFPFLDGVILGTVFAYVGRPIRDKFKKRRRLGAFVAAICIVVPIFLILGLGTLEVANQIITLAQNQEVLRGTLGTLIVGMYVPPVVNDIIASSLQNLAGIIAPIAAGVPVLNIGRTVSLGIINFIISIPVCYFVLLDGENFVNSIINLLPPKEEETYRKYITRIDRILSGIFLGTIYTSILGSLIAAAIFYAFGLPRPFALASFVFIAGMVPILTAWLVIIPVTLYRYINLGFSEALVFFIVAACLIYLPSELLIRPYLVSTKSSMHPLLVMLSFFGGALVAGIGGFFLAPAVMGVIVGIYQVRREELASCRATE